MDLEIGKVYFVKSQRKGNFFMRITTNLGTSPFVSGIITKGRAGAMLPYNEVEAGEEVTVRKELCIFTLCD